MSIKIGEFIHPTSVEEALKYKGKPDVMFVAGSTAVGKVENINVRKMVNLLTLPLAFVEKEGNTIRIGATTPLDDVENSPAIKKYLPILIDAVRHVGAWGIKTMATMGGAVATAFPWSDVIPALLALDASLTISRKEGRLTLSMEEFVSKRISMLKSCIIEYIEIEIPQTTNWGFEKYAHSSFDIAMLNIAYLKTEDNLRVAVGARPGIAKRLKNFEKHRDILEGIKEAELKDDARASKWWREQVLSSRLKELIS